MKKLAILAVAGLMAGQVWAGAFQAKTVSDSARWVLHADLDQMKETQLGTFVTDKLEAGEAGNKMAALAAILQFDPRKDLKGVTLYGKSRDPLEAVALFEGTFNVPQLVTLLKANPSYETVSHGSIPIHSWIDEKKPDVRMYGCALSGKVLISQGLPMMREALDVLGGTHAGLDATKVFGELPVQEPFFMAGTDLPALGGQAEAQMLSQAKTARVALGEKAGQATLTVLLTTVDPETAVKLQQVAQGLLAMGQMSQEKEPGLVALMQATQVTVNGPSVQMTTSMASEKLVALIQEKMDKASARKTPPPAAASPAPIAP